MVMVMAMAMMMMAGMNKHIYAHAYMRTRTDTNTNTRTPHNHTHTHTLIEKGNWISHTGVNPPQSQPKVILFVGPVLPTTPLLETAVFLTVHLVHSFFEILPGLDQ